MVYTSVGYSFCTSERLELFSFQVRDETYTAFENIYPVLTEFRKVQQWYALFLIKLSLQYARKFAQMKKSIV
jgi:DNA-directed RNA polymerase subunit F